MFKLSISRSLILSGAMAVVGPAAMHAQATAPAGMVACAMATSGCADPHSIRYDIEIAGTVSSVQEAPGEIFPSEGMVDKANWSLDTNLSREAADAPAKITQVMSMANNVMTRRLYTGGDFAAGNPPFAVLSGKVINTDDGLEIEGGIMGYNFESNDPAYKRYRMTAQVRDDGKLAIRYSRQNASDNKFEEVSRYIYNLDTGTGFVAIAPEPWQLSTTPGIETLARIAPTREQMRIGLYQSARRQGSVSRRARARR